MFFSISAYNNTGGDIMIGFIAGVLVGLGTGIVTMCLCIASGKAEESAGLK